MTTESLHITARTTARRIAEYLARNGVRVGGITLGDDDLDDEIRLSETLSVQVGRGYALIVEEVSDGVIFGKSRHDALDILSDIRTKLDA